MAAADDARNGDLLQVAGGRGKRVVRHVGIVLASAQVGCLVGPTLSGGGWWRHCNGH